MVDAADPWVGDPHLRPLTLGPEVYFVVHGGDSLQQIEETIVDAFSSIDPPLVGAVVSRVM
jgi:hypothetical protein